MRDRLVLLSGWGLGTAPLEPLAAALRGVNERLQVGKAAILASGWMNWTPRLRRTAGWVAGRWAACWPRNWQRGAAIVAVDC